MKKLLFLVAVFVLFQQNLLAQYITVDTTISEQVLVADSLVSGCVQAYDINFTGDGRGIGYFNATGTPFYTTITSGIILASGNATNAIGPNNSGSITTGFGLGGDADLQTLVTQTLNDASVLTFNFIPSSDTLKFNYVFGSDEYLEFVNSGYNDVFAFFLTGPDPNGGVYFNENIAMVPGTTTPVTINNVNHLLNTTYFFTNTSQSNEPVQYDGYTVGLSATAIVVPCETYSIKLAVADAGDSSYDSGVFLEAGSFTDGTNVVLDNINPTGTQNDLYEGCTSYYVFSRTDTVDLSFPATISLSFSGTATNGVDLTQFPTTIVIPVGQISDTISYTVFSDNVVEPTETFIINILSGCPCNPEPVSDTITIYNYKEFKASIINTDSMFCGMAAPPSYDIVATCVSHPAWFIDYTWSTGSTDSVITIIPPQPGQHSVYWVEIADICGNSIIDSITVGVSNLAGLQVTKTDALCNGFCNGTVNANPVTIGPTPGVYFKWGGTAGIPDSPTGIKNNLCYGNYTVTVTDPSFCAYTQPFFINQPNTALSPNSGILPIDSIYCSDPGSITLTASANIPQVTYAWNGGSTASNVQTFPVSQGINTYFVKISDYCGYAIYDTVKVYYSNIANSTLTFNPTSCFGFCDGTVNLLTPNGIPPFTFQWGSENHGSWTSSTGQNNTLCSDTFYVNVVDAAGCNFSETFIIEQPELFNPEETFIVNVDTVWCGTAPPPTIELQTTTNISSVNYLWSTGATTAYTAVNTLQGTHTYTVTVSDNCGNSKIDEIQIVVSTLAGANVSTQGVSCFNSCDGLVTITPTGGINPISYEWNAGGQGSSNSGIINTLCKGSYSVTVSDAGGCNVVKNFAITGPDSLSFSSITNTQTAWCGVTAPGSITINTNANTNVFYEWSNGSASPSITITPVTGANLFWVEFTDQCNNTHRDTIIFSISNFSGANTFTTAANCFGECDGQVTVGPLFGITPYSFAWSIPGIGTTSNPVLTNVCAGVYQVTVSDAALCSVVKNFSITQPDTIQFSFISNDATSETNCNGFASAVNVTGGIPPYTYKWNNTAGSTTYNIGNLCPGLYEVSVTDSKNCVVSDTIRVLNSTIGIESPDVSEFIQIYPNPSSNGSITISNQYSNELISLKLYDVNGRLIRENLEGIKPSARIELHNLPAGVNLLYLEFSNREKTFHKVVILE